MGQFEDWQALFLQANGLVRQGRSPGARTYSPAALGNGPPNNDWQPERLRLSQPMATQSAPFSYLCEHRHVAEVKRLFGHARSLTTSATLDNA
jgi:hypothetical protein